MNAAAEVSKTKPIVALKGGMTKAGARAVFSHTSALAGRSEIFEAALKQAGDITANSLEELYDITKAFAFLPLPKGSGVLIVESTGGAGVLAADMCEKFSLKLPEPDEHAKKKLRKILSRYCTLSNPFDLTTDAFTPSRFRSVIEENMENAQFHGFILILDGPIPGAAEEIKKASTETAKPILVSYLGGGETELVETSKMHSMGIPVFPSPERAVMAFYALVKYSEYLKKRV
jgi:acyl-CoA synthetase (NDP forming)